MKARDLFGVEGVSKLDKECLTFAGDGEYPYFTRTVFNNGIYGRVRYYDLQHLAPGNSLAVGMMGMKFFYMEHDFYAGQFVKRVYPLFEGFNERVALWFVAWFNKSSERFKGNLVRHFDRVFGDTDLVVPYIAGNVATDFITERMRELEEERMRELRAYLEAAGFDDCTLTKDEQEALQKMECGEVRMERKTIGSLFTLVKGKRLTKADMVKGNIRFIGATAINNGITNLIGNRKHLHPANTISVNYNGSVGEAFYQTEEYWASDDVNVFHGNDELTEDIALYYLAPIKKCGKQYAYNFKWTKEKMEQDYIFIPLTSSGTPDHAFMTRYIRAIKKQVIARLKAEIDREQKAYAQATR